MSAPNILAGDMSLTASGLAYPNGTSALYRPYHKDGIARVLEIRDMLVTLARGLCADLVVLEGYSYGSKHQAHQLGELGGQVRGGLYEASIPFVVIPPSTNKLYATGNGGAGKPAVTAEAIRRLGYAGHDDNEADALWLRALALDAYGYPIVAMPAKHRAALTPKRKAKRNGQPAEAAFEWPALPPADDTPLLLTAGVV